MYYMYMCNYACMHVHCRLLLCKYSYVWKYTTNNYFHIIRLYIIMTHDGLMTSGLCQWEDTRARR